MIWMTARRFDWALRTRGCTIAAWPAGDRDPALRLLRRSATARQMLADAMVAEDMASEDMADEPVPQAAESQALARMQGVVRRALRPTPPVLRGMRWAAIAACAVAGLYLGGPALDLDLSVAFGPAIQVDVPATVLAALD